MKQTMILLAAAATMMMFNACSSSKAVAPEQRGRVEMDLPCIEESYDNDEYFKAMGTATNMNQQNARDAAFDAAKSMLMKRLGGFAKGLATDYSRTVSGDAEVDRVQRLMESEIITVIERLVNDAYKTCEKMYQNQAGNYESYIAIRVSKAEIIRQTQSELSKNQELEIEFNREQFRKFAEKRMRETPEQTPEQK